MQCIITKMYIAHMKDGNINRQIESEVHNNVIICIKGIALACSDLGIVLINTNGLTEFEYQLVC